MDKKHVFVDYYDIDAGYGVDNPGYRPLNGSPYGVKIVQHKPKIELEPVICCDKPWDELRAGMANVIKLSDKKYIAYYEGINKTPEWINLCYAESEDGVHWVKPDLGLVEFNGNKNNNIVKICGAPYLNYVEEGDVVYYDKYTENENERFKTLYTKVSYKDGKVTDVSMFSQTSKDGIHWENERYAFKGGDAFATLFYDEDLGKYVATVKSQYSNHLARRTLILSESADFINWSKPRLIMNGNATIDPDIDYYQTAMTKWEGASDAYVMFPPTFHRTGDYLESNLVLTRDLYTFTLFDINNPVISQYDCRAKENYMSPGCIAENGKYIHFFTPFAAGHNEGSWESVHPDGLKMAGTNRAIFREDGYTSLRSESHGGFTTIPFNVGKRIIFNCDIQVKGYIKVALTEDEKNIPYEGFGFEDCKLEKKDEVSYEVVFSKPLTELPKNTKVRLKVEMFKADLYSFTFKDVEEFENEEGDCPYKVI